MNVKQKDSAKRHFDSLVELASRAASKGLQASDCTTALRRFRTATEYLGQATGISYVARIPNSEVFNRVDESLEKLERRLHNVCVRGG